MTREEDYVCSNCHNCDPIELDSYKKIDFYRYFKCPSCHNSWSVKVEEESQEILGFKFHLNTRVPDGEIWVNEAINRR